MILAQLALVAIVTAVHAPARPARPLAPEREIAGVRVPEKVQVGEKDLALNGAGLRTKTVFKVKVYVAGLYLEKPTRDAAQVIASETIKRVELTFLRELDRKQIAEAIEDGFERNSKKDLPALKERLDELCRIIPDVNKRDAMQITYVPGKGTTIAVRGEERGTIEGKDFADALFLVWLGRDPVDRDLRTALLGG
jgi:Chalcone isomerase-like